MTIRAARTGSCASQRTTSVYGMRPVTMSNLDDVRPLGPGRLHYLLDSGRLDRAAEEDHELCEA
jgi:hypothetical protein